MGHESALLITSAFLFLILVVQSLYLVKRKKSTHLGPRQPFRPVTFLVAMLGIVSLSLVFLAGLGFSQSLLSFSLASGVVLSLFSPVCAVSFLIANIIIRPWEMGAESGLLNVLPRVLALIALFSWVIHNSKGTRWKLVWNRSCTIFALFMLWLVLSAIFSSTMEESLSVLFYSFFPIVIIVLLIINTIAKKQDIRLLTYTLVLSVTAVICLALVNTIILSDFQLIGAKRLEGMGLFGNSNDLAALIVAVLPFTFSSLVRTSAGVFYRLGMLAVIMPLLTALWLSQSRAAILALVLGSGGYILYRLAKSAMSGSFRGDLRFILGAGGLLCLLGLFFVVFGFSRDASDLEISSSARFNYLIAGLGMLKAHPVFGVGIGNYPAFYELYTPLFYEWGSRTAHSSWVLVMSEAGVAGLFLFAFLYFLALKEAWRLRIEGPEFLLSLVSYGVVMSFLSHTYILLPYLLFAYTLAAARVHGCKQRAGSKEAKFDLFSKVSYSTS